MTGLEAAARRAAKGDGQAFEAVCQALQDDVWRYCYALTGDQELASEAAQAVVTEDGPHPPVRAEPMAPRCARVILADRATSVRADLPILDA